MGVLAAADVATRVNDFGALVGLVLVFITLFTNQRDATLRGLPANPKATKADATSETWLLLALAAVTLLLFLAGLPVVVEAATGWTPRAFAGPLRAALVLSWVLLLGLLAWQIALARRAHFKVRPKLSDT